MSTAPKRKTAARTQKAAESYVRRPSQITKKMPTKRLKKRRTINLQTPRGMFPNPKKRDPTYWVIIKHDGYLSYRSDSGYTGSTPYDNLSGNTPAQKVASFIKQLGLKRGQYEIIDENESTKKNPVSGYAKKVQLEKYKHIAVEMSDNKRAWQVFALFPDSPTGAQNAIEYAKAFAKKEPKIFIRVVTK